MCSNSLSWKDSQNRNQLHPDPAPTCKSQPVVLTAGIALLHSPFVQSNFHKGPWSSTLQFTTNIAFSLNFKYLLEHSKDLKRAQPSLFILFSSQPCIAGRDDLPPAPYCSLPKAGKASSPHAADTSKAPKPFMNQMKHERTQAERSNCSLWALVFPLNPHLTWTHRKVFSALQNLPQIT